MRRRVGILVAFAVILTLVGCFSDQKEQAAKCQISTDRHDPNDVLKADNIKLCMRAHGYAFVQADCPASVRIPSDSEMAAMAARQGVSPSDTDRYNLWTGVHLEVFWTEQAEEPLCYEPFGWGARQSLKLEKLIGKNSN
jgi:hypothetical protein